MMPVSPPIRNIDRNPNVNSMGEANRIRPPNIVASQLKNLMPVGIDTSRLAVAKNKSTVRLMPTQYIWWAHTPRLMKAMAMVAAAMNS